ncbi:hypothetical protein AALP_AAs69211U000100 [Arabis alpina]|uniref:Uncharacterized protein n=1 Tax=Arabis alpina TaxID=50452 RepID=A0A087G3A8_ARAAL|nr:hypothetical protein AALP_AAs69211U000100 [Arabis alpina]
MFALAATEDQDDDDGEDPRISLTQQRFTPPALLLHHSSLRPPIIQQNLRQLILRFNFRSEIPLCGKKIHGNSTEICEEDLSDPTFSPVKEATPLVMLQAKLTTSRPCSISSSPVLTLGGVLDPPQPPQPPDPPDPADLSVSPRSQGAATGLTKPCSSTAQPDMRIR